MGWATGHIVKLQEGSTVKFRPRGNSMKPRIKSGQLCTVSPVNPDEIEPGDIVLCRVRGAEYLHLVAIPVNHEGPGFHALWAQRL